MELLLVGGNRNRFVSGRAAWLRKALVAVLCAMVGNLPLNLLIALAMCIAALLMVSGGVAQAAPPALIPDGQFESQGALGVAVDNSGGPSRGDVYTAGSPIVLTGPKFIAGLVNKFDASGNLFAPPSPFAKPPPALPEVPELLGYSGVAVNPSNGNAYALDA